MFTKLDTTENNPVLVLETEEGEKLNGTLTHLTILRQEEMMLEAAKLRSFAELLGLDSSRLETAIKIKGRNRYVTIRFVDDDGVEVGSFNEQTGRGYTFGTVYKDKVCAKSTNGLQRVLHTISNYPYALNTAKDSLLNLACERMSNMVPAHFIVAA